MFAILFLLINPLSTQAQTVDTAQLVYDLRCWKKRACENVGRGIAEESPICGGAGSNWYRCRPKGAPIPLQIELQGTKEVVDIADYIARIYQYTVSIGGILATVMIVWGGIVYLTAGGNPTRIGQAKEFISNALIGSVLLFTSYLLLQTLNPDLVTLRMPTIYLMRPKGLSAMWCKDLQPLGDQPTLNFAEADKPITEINNYPISVTISDPPNPDAFNHLTCNIKYYEELHGDDPCKGSGGCPSGFVCMPNSETDTQPCKVMRIGGTIGYQHTCFGLDHIQLVAICNNRVTIPIGYGYDPVADSAQQRPFSYSLANGVDVLRRSCDRSRGLQGFLMGIEMAEFDGGDDDEDYFLVGKKVCENPSTPIHKITPGPFSPAFIVRLTEEKLNEARPQFWTLEELERGVQCNLNLSPTQFPTGEDVFIDDCAIPQ